MQNSFPQEVKVNRQQFITMVTLMLWLLTACQAPHAAPTAAIVVQPSPEPSPTIPLRDGEVAIETVASATLTIAGSPDFLEIGSASIWVVNSARIDRIDLATNQIVATVPMASPCAAPAIGYGSIWVYNCGEKQLYRIDESTNNVLAKIQVGLADSEGSVAAGEGGVWILSDSKGILSRIDPNTNKVVAEIMVEPASFAVMTGYGSVWVTNWLNGSIQRVDPKTNKVIATISVGAAPRFLAVGEEGVWTLNQSDGTVSHVDPKTNSVVATIKVGIPEGGGDIAAGEGAVWVRGTDTFLTLIDPKTNKITKRYGPRYGSGAVRAREGSVWVSAHDVNKVWRLPPAR